jgi:hypothetical protein
VTQNTDPNTMSYQWQSPGNQVEKQPVVKIDYNLSSKHRLSGTYNWQVVIRDPDQLNGGDVRFPSAPNYSKYISYRPLTSASLRSTLTPSLVNEIRGGALGPRLLRPGYEQQPADVHRHGIMRAGPRPRHELAHAERPELAQRLELEHRRHGELADRQAQP